MGNIDTSMGYVVNDDGSITRINSTQHQSSRSPNFIPVTLSNYGGSPKGALYLLAFFAIILLHMGIILFGIQASETNNWMNNNYRSYTSYRNENNHEKANEYFSYYEGYKEDRNQMFGLVVLLAVGSIVADCWAVPRLLRTFPGKKNVLKGVEYIQSNLGSNHRYPYIMTNNLIGILSIRKGKIIIPPNYDDIRWVIPKKVFCAERQGKKMFYDINGDILNNVPQSYYNN